MKKLLIAIFLFCAVMPCVADDIDGKWQGVLDLGQAKLKINLNFKTEEGGATIVTLDSPDQGAYGIPGKVEFLSADSVYVSVNKLFVVFKGHYDAKEMTGTFKQGFNRIPLILTKAAEKVKPTNDITPLPYATRELQFNAKDGTTLCGTFCLPEGYKEGDKVTAVVMVTGSGQQNRDEELFGHKPFAVIADYLARNGVASFRYDDRGVGCSGGDPAEVTLESNLGDALAALAMVKGLPEVEKAGILGHSEGGLIGYMATAQIGGPSFVVSLAGPAIKGDSILALQNRRALSLSGVDEALQDVFCKALREMLTLPEDASAEMIEGVFGGDGAQIPEVLKVKIRELRKPQYKWLRSFANYDPAVAIRNMRVPVLLLNGEKDVQVPAAVNVEAFNKLADGRYGTAKIMPGLNHLFQHCETGEPSEYGEIEETIAPEVLEEVGNFIKSEE